jgi:hypothetical protein
MRLPNQFLLNLLKDMQLDKNDTSAQAILGYTNLKDIIQIFENCPAVLLG